MLRFQKTLLLAGLIFCLTAPVVFAEDGSASGGGIGANEGNGIGSEGGGTQGGVACPQITTNLHLGSTGPEVVLLQTFLAKYPQYYPSGQITGYFGLLTQLAVQAYQRANGIVASGTWDTTGYGALGPQTRSTIGGSCKSGSSSAGTVNTIVGATTVNRSNSTLEVEAPQCLLSGKIKLWIRWSVVGSAGSPSCTRLGSTDRSVSISLTNESGLLSGFYTQQPCEGTTLFFVTPGSLPSYKLSIKGTSTGYTYITKNINSLYCVPIGGQNFGGEFNGVEINGTETTGGTNGHGGIGSNGTGASGEHSNQGGPSGAAGDSDAEGPSSDGMGGGTNGQGGVGSNGTGASGEHSNQGGPSDKAGDSDSSNQDSGLGGGAAILSTIGAYIANVFQFALQLLRSFLP